MAWSLLEAEVQGDTFAAVFTDGEQEVEIYGDVLELTAQRAVFTGIHVQGPGANRIGPSIRSLARWVKEFLDVRRLRIEGATRTSGASPGRKPAPLEF